MQKIKHERQLVRVKSETIMGQVSPWVGLDCVGLGQKFSTFNESGCDGSNCKKRAEVYQYILLLHICTVCFVFFGSGFVRRQIWHNTRVNISTNYLLMNRESLNNKSGT